MSPRNQSFVRRSLLAGWAVAALAIASCGSNSDSSSTTAAATTATTVAPETSAVAETTVAPESSAAETTAMGEGEEAPVTTNAPAVPAEVANGAATITVTVGTDDFTTSGGTRVVSVPKGTQVTLQFTDPAKDREYHLHGYDLEQKAAKGATGTIQFVADQTGQFDVEDHIEEMTVLVLVVV